MVPFFKVCQQLRAFLSGSCLAHDLAAFDSLLLALRHTGKPVGRKLINRPWALVGHMRLKRQPQCGTLPDNPHASVAMAMDASLMPLGPLEPTLSLQIGRGTISRLTTHKHPRLKAAHQLGAMLMDGGGARLPRLLPREQRRLTLRRCHCIARLQSGLDRLQGLGLAAPLVQGIPGDIASTVNAASQPVPQRRSRPPWWAGRLRGSESRPSCKASRLRQPGGRRGPPGRSWRIPRTAAPSPRTTSPASSSTGTCPGVAKARPPGAPDAAASEGALHGVASPWGRSWGRVGSGAAACRRSVSTRRSRARRPRTCLRILTCAGLARSTTGWATSRRTCWWQERCGTPPHPSAMAVPKASCLSALHARTGLSKGAAPCRARMLNRRPACGARDHQGSANHPRVRLNSRTTYTVAWPFAGGRPSIVSTKEPISREASASSSGSGCRAARLV
jgi:hypothetical protein